MIAVHVARPQTDMGIAAGEAQRAGLGPSERDLDVVGVVAGKISRGRGGHQVQAMVAVEVGNSP